MKDKIIADIDFNRDDNRKEFGTEDRVVRVTRFREDDRHRVGLGFELGHKEDDTLYLTFELAELLTAIASCVED